MKELAIEKYLNSHEFKTREQLQEETGLCDREIRKQISELKNRRVVIYSSSRSGYRLAKEEKLEKALYNWIDANDVVEEDIVSMIERT